MDEKSSEESPNRGENGVGDASAAGPRSSAAGPRSSSDSPKSTEKSSEGTLQEERDHLKDQLLRTAADFDNFRKRTRRDLEDAERRGREHVLKDVLPVIDNLERAVEASAQASNVAAVVEGIQMVLKQFEEVASRIGLERVTSVGARFDPTLHDAVQQLETEEHPAGTIVAEVVPGYQLRDKLIRAALVVVARPPAAATGDGTRSDSDSPKSSDSSSPDKE